jgi:hypothetical protein
MNDSRNKFERAAKKNRQATQAPETKEMSLSQRMTRVRGGESSTAERESAHPNWRPSHPDDRLTARTAPQTTVVAPRKTASGVVEDAQLAAAREAEQARRAALKDQATGLAKHAEFVPEDFQAVMSGWIFRNSTEVAGSFPMTPFNCQNLSRCVYWQVMSGQPGWTKFGISELDTAHEWLAANGYYENPATQRRSVHPMTGTAAKEFPVWESHQQQADEPIRTGNRPVFVRGNADEEAAAKKLSFDDLQRQARQRFKQDQR